ncbi:MAG TPA: sigma 54-interacting transcriptional regulator [Puia sp.]|nr:sigma 54-interacting transcriptional regulator [Puia sp.]
MFFNPGHQQIIVQLGQDIAMIKNREQLDNLINGSLKEKIGFQHSTIFILKNDGREISNFLKDYGGSESRGQFPETILTGKIPFDHKINDPAIQPHQRIVDFDELVRNGNVEPYLAGCEMKTNAKVYTFPLLHGSSTIGVWIILFKETKETFEPAAVCPMIPPLLTFAINTIQTQEEIEARQKEREIIQSLNIDFATIREKKDLLKIIHYKLKSLFNFSHHWVATVNEDELTMSTFMQDAESRSRFHPRYNYVTAARYPISDQVFNKVILAGEPVIFDLEQLNARTAIPEYLQINYESGIRKVVMQSLEIAGRFIGVWAICLGENHELQDTVINLIGDLANQFSIAVGNIIANEIIQTRDAERELLLKLSYDITSTKDRKGLLRIIQTNLKRIFRSQNIVITVLNDQEQTHDIFLSTDLGFTRENLARYTREPAWFEYNDGYFNKVMEAEGIVLFGIALRDDNRNIGVLYINLENNTCYSDHELKIVKGASYQISMAVSNILANEKINQQLTEIGKYKQQLEEETFYIREEIEKTYNNGDIIGESPLLKKIFRLISQVAASDSTVLILGETGTGKELIARAIHNDSPRKNKLMVKVNCAALPPNLIESELFGHERGSFTGATEQRVGKFELANGSTLFLDEIGDMPLDLQVKLLRVLQEKEIERLGGRKTIKIDVRIVAATNRNLQKEVAEGRFRSDLFYRLNIFPIFLPPLRDRREDIPLLAAFFIQRFAKKAGRQITTFSNRALQEMIQYSWPGNIRELEHLIERSVLLSSGDTIKQIHLPANDPAARRTCPEEVVIKTIDENEREHILRILKYCGGKIAGDGGAAQILGVPPGTLYSKLKRLGIRREHSFPVPH